MRTRLIPTPVIHVHRVIGQLDGSGRCKSLRFGITFESCFEKKIRLVNVKETEIFELKRCSISRVIVVVQSGSDERDSSVSRIHAIHTTHDFDFFCHFFINFLKYKFWIFCKHHSLFD